MPDSKKAIAIEAFVALMKTIISADDNDYEISTGENTFKGARTALEEHELPGMIINQGKGGTTSKDVGVANKYIKLEINARILLKNNENYYEVGEKSLADIELAMGTSPQLGGLAMDMEFGENQISLAEVGESNTKSEVIAVSVDVTIYYRTRILSPYN